MVKNRVRITYLCCNGVFMRNIGFIKYLVIFLPVLTFAREPLAEKPKAVVGINSYIFAPTGFSFASSLLLDNNIDFRKSIYGSHLITAGVSKLINPSIKMTFRYDNKIIDRVKLTNRFKLFNFIHFITGYTWWNYCEYKISEHNLYFYADTRFGVPKIFLLSIVAGLGSKIIDLDITTTETTANTDYLFQTIFVWKISMNFFITKYYHTGLELTNSYDDEPYSFGYYQVSLVNTVLPSKEYGVTFDMGVGFAGVGSLAGYPNRFYIAIGGLYEYYFR